MKITVQIATAKVVVSQIAQKSKVKKLFCLAETSFIKQERLRYIAHHLLSIEGRALDV